MKQITTHELASRGERAAEVFLCNHGLILKKRNWRAGALGEVDLVMQDRDQIVFVEVKTRRSKSFAPAVEAVDNNKLNRLRQLALNWMAQSVSWLEYRIDLVAIKVDPSKGPTSAYPTKAQLIWLKGVDR